MDLICVAQRGHEYRGESAHFIPSTTPGKTNCLTTVAKDNLIAEMKDKQIIQVNPSSESNGKQPYQQNRVYDANGKSPALMSGHAQSSINTLMGGGIGLQL